MNEASGAKKRLVRRWVAAVAVVALAGLGVFALAVVTDPWEWIRNRSRYEGIVHRVEAIGVPPGEARAFLVSFDKDPASLQAVADLAALPDLYGKMVRGEVVEAERKSDGRLTVRIKMPGRRPTYEVVYVSGQTDPGEVDRHGMARAQPLAEHWWGIEDRSD